MLVGGRIGKEDVGFIVMSAGIGIRITAGVGRLSTTEDGIAPAFTAGTGYPATLGVQHG